MSEQLYDYSCKTKNSLNTHVNEELSEKPNQVTNLSFVIDYLNYRKQSIIMLTNRNQMII